MRQVVEYETEDGGIFVEMEVADAGIERVSRAGEVVKAAETFEHAFKPVGPVARGVIAELRGLAEPPDEIGVAFGIKLGARVGAIITCADAEANFTVTLTWKRPQDRPQSDVHAPGGMLPSGAT